MLQSTVIISACARFIDEVTQRAPGLPAVWQPLAITFFTDAQGIPTHSSSVHACKTAGEFARSAAEAGRRRGRTPHATLDDKRRLKMATDTARGMNYLHSCRPPIIHRDLKSPNLLVDKDFTIKACYIGFWARGLPPRAEVAQPASRQGFHHHGARRPAPPAARSSAALKRCARAACAAWCRAALRRISIRRVRLRAPPV